MQEMLNQALAFSAVIGGFTASAIAIGKSPLGKFFSRSLKREARDLMLATSKEANEPLVEKTHELDAKIDDLHGYTRYHLGPNGTAKSIHRRVEDLAKDLDKFTLYQHDRNHDILSKITVEMARTELLKIRVEQYIADDATAHKQVQGELGAMSEQLGLIEDPPEII